MAAVHIAHDCIVHDNVIMANMSTLGGHVEIQEFASLEEPGFLKALGLASSTFQQ